MKLLADENFPPTLISYLQQKRHNVKRIQRTAKGVSDISVRERAIKENRVIITFDKDFLKSEQTEKLFSVMIFDFPNMMPAGVIPYMDSAIKSIVNLKKRKKRFAATYSTNGLELTR